MARHPHPRSAKPQPPPPAPARLGSAALALAAVAALVACASNPGRANAQLQGRWRVDSAASDDASARITSAIRTAQKQRARHFRADDGAGEEFGNGGGSGDDAAANNFDLGARIGPDFQQLRARLLQTLDSPSTLSFKVESDDVQIERDGLPGRDYQPGDTITRFEEYGTAQLKSAWRDQAFVLNERYTSGARLEERYALDAHGALVYTRSLRDPAVGRIEIRSVYRRTG
ncbi:MAG TPA: hypothetical protein VHY19_01240 [Steroidobacteraceae bacterium]|jgi:hypothetical protein|nr:hypothetical protein [Steroidobacteraceae bacterium]